jgi:hypothetical protein
MHISTHLVTCISGIYYYVLINNTLFSNNGKIITYAYSPIPVDTRSKAWICSRLLAVIAGANHTGDEDFLSSVSVVCCYVQVFATGCSLVQRSPNECGASEC